MWIVGENIMEEAEKYNFEVMSIEFVAENIILQSYKFY